MIKVQTLDELQEKFLNGDVAFPEPVSIDGVVYRFQQSSSNVFEHVINRNKKDVILYETAWTDQKLNELLFVWAVNEQYHVVPSGVVLNARAVVENDSPAIIAEDGDPNNVIGDTVRIRFTSMPGSPTLRGKVDTGAEISSLHADKWNINGRKVELICPKISPNVIVLPLLDQQAVKSANGVQYRPVVELSVKVNDKLLNNVVFNIADRSSMDYPVLVGKNILEKGRFLIDPSLTESSTTIDWNLINEAVQSVEAASREQALQQVYQTLKHNNVSFSELVKYIRRDLTNSLDTEQE